MPMPPPTPGVVGLEMPHHPPQQQHLLLFPAAHHLDADSHFHNQPIRPSYAYAKGKQKQQPALYSEDEPAVLGDECGVDVAAKPLQPPAPTSSSASPWHRMKWTDSMVRLLIMVVYCVGDESGGGPEGGDGGQPHPTISSCSTTARKAAGDSHQLQQQQQQQQQKKGKWKSVSRAMMEKGFFVSPQQCEDKFNDLNKRFKRVNDILGRGTACRVVENPSLLEAMDHLAPKAREEARKLLNSKHLFFREMCAYHSSTSSSSTAPTGSPHAGAASMAHHLPCVLVREDRSMAHYPSECGATSEEEEAIVGREREEEEEDYDEDEGEDHGDHHPGETGWGRGKHLARRHPVDEGGGLPEEEVDRKGFLMKRQRTSLSSSSSLLLWPSPPPSPLSLRPSSPPLASAQQLLRCELTELAGSGEQQRQWVRRRAVELEESRVGHECRALELQRRRFRWLRFSGEKEREMERTRLENERRRLENERMLLLLRQKELDLLLAAREGGGRQDAPADSPAPKTGG